MSGTSRSINLLAEFHTLCIYIKAECTELEGRGILVKVRGRQREGEKLSNICVTRRRLDERLASGDGLVIKDMAVCDCLG